MTYISPEIKIKKINKKTNASSPLRSLSSSPQEPQCKVCKQTPVIRSSKHLFLDLPKVRSRICTSCNGCNCNRLTREMTLLQPFTVCDDVQYKRPGEFSFSCFTSCSWRLSWSSGWRPPPAQETGRQMPNRSLAPGWGTDSNLAASPETCSGEPPYLTPTLKRRSAALNFPNVTYLVVFLNSVFLHAVGKTN